MRDLRGALALLVFLTGGCSPPGAEQAASPPPATTDPARPLPSPVPEVVARVNGQPVHIGQILALAKADLDRVSVDERDQRKPEVVRRALDRYVERELLLQEALARGIQAESRDVEWAYDQMRREHPDEAAWEEFLGSQGLDPQSVKQELRAQLTVARLIREEKEAGRDPDALAGRLRARARIELFL